MIELNDVKLKLNFHLAELLQGDGEKAKNKYQWLIKSTCCILTICMNFINQIIISKQEKYQ